MNISILHALTPPGVRRTQEEIAKAVGCTQALIYLEEKKALRKVREQLRAVLGVDYGAFFQRKASDHL